MLRLSITGVAASVTEEETLTAGRVGLQCGFSFDAVWNGLFKTAVFEGVETVDVALDDSNVCTVPWECMAVEGVQLKCGVYGANGEGTIVIPTVWAKFGKIQPSPAPSGTEPAEPTQNANAYAVETAEEALSIAQSVRDDADNGEFDGAPGAPGVSPTVTVTDIEGGHTVTVTDAEGTQSFDVMDGADGQNGADGTDGEDGSLIWKTDVTPTTVLDAVQWNISDLTGRVGAEPQEGDLVFYSYYYYRISKVVNTGENPSVTAVDPVSIRGPQGEPGGGGGGTDDYEDLDNKPQINGTTLIGDKSLSDLGIAAASAVPAAATSAPADLGTADVGSSAKYAKEDHVHNKPTYTKSDVGLGNVDNVKQYSATNPPPYPVSSVNGQTGAVSLTIPSTASDVGAVAVAQGVAHAGEFVVVGSDGNITTVTMAAWQGGSY